MLGKTLKFSIAALAVAAVGSANAALVGHWTLDETTGTTAADSSGNGYDTTQSGTISSIAGVAGNAQVAPRLGASAAHSDILNLDGGSVTLSLWAQGGSSTASFRALGGFEGTGSTGDIYSLKVSQGVTDAINWTFRGTGPLVAPGTFNSYAAANASGFAHIVGTYDGVTGDAALYVNGVSVATTNNGAGIPDKTTPGLFNIGRYFNSNSFAFDKAIDDVQVYDEALDASQVASLFAAPGSVVPEPSSLALLGLGGLCMLRRRRA